MVEDRELLLLLITTAASGAAWWNQRRIASLPDVRLLLFAILALNCGYAATVVEGFLDGTAALLANVFEHACYLAHTVLILAWVYRRRGRLASSP